MSDRWGGEEKKGQGVVGCAFAGLLLLLAVYIGYKAYPAISTRYEYQKKVMKIVTSSKRPKAVEIENKLIKEAKKMGYDLQRDDIEIDINMAQVSAPIVKVTIFFRFEVDFGFGKREISLPPIYEEATLIEF